MQARLPIKSLPTSNGSRLRTSLIITGCKEGTTVSRVFNAPTTSLTEDGAEDDEPFLLATTTSTAEVTTSAPSTFSGGEANFRMASQLAVHKLGSRVDSWAPNRVAIWRRATVAPAEEEEEVEEEIELLLVIQLWSESI